MQHASRPPAHARRTAAAYPALQPRCTRRVALLGPYASRNLGDTASQMSVIQNLRRRLPEVQIVGLSPEPEDTLRSLGIPSFPLSASGSASGYLADEPALAPRVCGRFNRALRTARRSNAFARTLDLLVISGGGQLDDFWGGPWEHPWALLRWASLARRHGAPVAFLGVGLDRLSSPLSRQFSLWALRLSNYRAFRDEGTLRSMQQLGLRAPSVVRPDVAFALKCSNTSRTGGAPFAVISPISSRTWSSTPDARHENYLLALSEAGEWLTQRGLRLRIACSQPSMDAREAATLARMLAARHVHGVQICNTDAVDTFLDQVRGAELVIAARLHGVILSLVAGAPVVALAPLPKVSQVMSDVGLARFCLPLQRFDRGELIGRAELALQQSTALRLQIARITAQFRARLRRTFDEVASLALQRGR